MWDSPVYSPQSNTVILKMAIVFFLIQQNEFCRHAFEYIVLWQSKHLSVFLHWKVSPNARTVTVDNETENTMRVTWQPSPGKVLSYRVYYRPRSGGRQMFGRVNAPTTSIVLKRLKPRTTYDLSVVPIYDFGQGKSRKAEGTTGMYDKLVQDLIIEALCLRLISMICRKVWWRLLRSWIKRQIEGNARGEEESLICCKLHYGIAWAQLFAVGIEGVNVV